MVAALSCAPPLGVRSLGINSCLTQALAYSPRTCITDSKPSEGLIASSDPGHVQFVGELGICFTGSKQEDVPKRFAHSRKDSTASYLAVVSVRYLVFAKSFACLDQPLLRVLLCLSTAQVVKYYVKF